MGCPPSVFPMILTTTEKKEENDLFGHGGVHPDCAGVAANDELAKVSVSSLADVESETTAGRLQPILDKVWSSCKPNTNCAWDNNPVIGDGAQTTSCVLSLIDKSGGVHCQACLSLSEGQ